LALSALVSLNDLDVARLRCVRIFAELTQRTTLPEEIPALIELLVQVPEARAALISRGRLRPNLVFLLDQGGDMRYND